VTARWLAALVGVGCAACRAEPARAVAGEPVRTAAVRRGDVVDRQVMTGELRAASAIRLLVPRTESFQLTIRWLADDGAAVNAGDRVVEFDNAAVTAQLEAKRLGLIEAEMTLRGAQDLDAVATAEKATALGQRQIELDKATVHASVPADLLAGRDAQDRQLAKQRAEVAVDKAAHELAAQREQAALDLRIKQIELDKARRAIEAAEHTIADLVVSAPRGGLVVVEDSPWLGRKFQVGDTVMPGMAVASLPDLTQAMEVHAELSDVDDGRVAVGMAGVCTLDAYPGDAMPCTVKGLTAVARSKGETSLRRAFAAVLALDRPADPARMRPGMSVKVELHPRAVSHVLVVPRGAVIAAPSDAARPARVRMASGELRDLALGACDAQGCAVVAGVSDGDAVVLGGGP
jgi:multidrug resistance efflux pump